MKYLFVCIGFLLLLSGCSSKKTIKYRQKPSTQKTKLQNFKAKPKKSVKKVDYKLKALQAEYKKWQGVDYKNGGCTKKGVDCSSFVQQVYYDAFGLHIPRTTKQQVKVGREISKKNLKAGDMVFFKTGWVDRHVGIYLQKGEFMHVSTKRGVSKSSLYNPYWRSKYWQSRRVLP
jgi:lipoprotein Spr/probable lipoprotein NlpC